VRWSFGIRRRHRVSPTNRLLETLKSLGLGPNHIVDVGGNHGNWTRAALAAFPSAKVTMFEPQEKLAKHHRDLAVDDRVAIYYKGLGDFDGVAPFTFHPRDDSSSFIYSASDALAQGMVQGEVELCRLDTAMLGSTFGQPDIIKIDAEGLDLNVLDGAPISVSRATIVLIEATVACPTYSNTAALIFQKMDGMGFRLFDITDLNRSPELGVLWLIEAVFVRKDTALAAAATQYQ
jgi:FkbM family methyltransferase